MKGLDKEELFIMKFIPESKMDNYFHTHVDSSKIIYTGRAKFTTAIRVIFLFEINDITEGEHIEYETIG